MVPNDRSSEIEINYKKYPFITIFGDLRSRKNKDKNRKCKIKNNVKMPIYGHHVTNHHMVKM